MANVIECQQGGDTVETIELVDRNGSTVTTFTGAAMLTAEVWGGDDQAVLFSPTATWSNATAGLVALSFARADTADLEPGDYPVLLTITAGGLQRKNRVATLRVLASPGAAEALPSYCGIEDLRRVCPWLDQMQTDSDQAGFAEARAEAREWFDELLHAAWGGRRSLGAEGGLWASSGPSGKDTWLQGELDADHLLVSRSIRRANALFAASLILAGQIGSQGDTSYQRLGDQLAAQAANLALTVLAEIDTDSDGEGDVSIYLGEVRVERG
jgi:hypothetical protein